MRGILKLEWVPLELADSRCSSILNGKLGFAAPTHRKGCLSLELDRFYLESWTSYLWAPQDPAFFQGLCQEVLNAVYVVGPEVDDIKNRSESGGLKGLCLPFCILAPISRSLDSSLCQR